MLSRRSSSRSAITSCVRPRKASTSRRSRPYSTRQRAVAAVPRNKNLFRYRTMNRTSALSRVAWRHEKKEVVMKKLLFAAAATAALTAATAVPASAQVYLGADPWGAGVRVGPFGLGVGPGYGWRGGYYAYG